MERGFNSDIVVDGEKYHIQTEDWGSQNPYVVSRVYYNGAVIKSYKTAYSSLRGQGPAALPQAIQAAMREQHRQILDLLLNEGELP